MEKKAEEDQDQKKKKLLNLFIECMRIETLNALDKHSYVSKDVPLECLVVSVDPHFVISDGIHKVVCELSHDALINMKQYYPDIKLKDLDKHNITLMRYAPHTNLGSNGDITLTLHVYEMSYKTYEGEKPQKIPAKIKDLVKDDEIKSRNWLSVYKHLRRFINREGVENLPGLESIIEDSHSKVSIGRIIKFKGEKVGTRDELGKAIVPYDKFDNEAESRLRDEAMKTLEKEKVDKKLEKEKGREKAKELKEKPRDMKKQLTEYAVSKVIAKSSQNNLVKQEGKRSLENFAVYQRHL